MGLTIADAIYDEGIEKGQLFKSRMLLRLLLQERFGPLSEDLIEKIDASDDEDALTKAALTVLRLKSIDELQI